MVQLECNTLVVLDEFCIDYKQLEMDIARQISPDIQETLAETVTNMLYQIQSGSVTTWSMQSEETQ